MPKRRATDENGEGEGQRNGGGVTMTAAKLLASLIAACTVLVTVVTFIFSTVIDARFAKFANEIHQNYAPKGGEEGAITRREYELRHAEILEEIRRGADRDKETSARADGLTRRLDEHERLDNERMRNGRNGR